MKWQPMRAPFPEMRMWGSQYKGGVYIMTVQTGGIPSNDPYLNKYAATFKAHPEDKQTDLGMFDTMYAADKACTDHAKKRSH